MAGEIGKLSAIITANAQGLFAEMDKAERRMMSFGNLAKSALGSIGVGLGVGGLFTAIGAAVEDAGRLVDVSQKLDIGVRQLQELELAAKTSGIEAATLHTAISKLQQKLGEAAAGSAEAQKDFEKLGLEWRNLIANDPGDTFSQVATKIGSLSDAYSRAASAQDMFGRGGKDMVGLLREFQEEVAKSRNALGTFTEQDAKKMDELGDRWTRGMETAKQAFKGAVVDWADAIGDFHATTMKLADIFAPANFMPPEVLDRLRNPPPPPAPPGFMGPQMPASLRMALEQQEKAAAKMADLLSAESFAEFDKFTDSWQRWAHSIAEDALDPLQKVQKQIEDIRFAWEQGFFRTEADFRRALAKAEESVIPKQPEFKPEKFPRADFAAQEFGGVGAASAINRFLNQRAGLAGEGRDKELRFLAEIAGGIRELAGAWGVADVGQ